MNMRKISMLICGDAGAAGRVLLARRDLEVRWALTAAEAKAVLDRSGEPGSAISAVIVREELALEVLALLGRMSAPPPCVVVVEQSGWARGEDYFAHGAMALVEESSTGRILEAVSELTGASFSTFPRVPYDKVLDVSSEGGRCYASAMDLSGSGVSVRGLMNAWIGLGVEVTFVMMDPPIVASGVVVRRELEGEELVAGVCFTGIDPADRARISAFVAEQHRALAPPPEPMGLTVDLAGPLTSDLGEVIDADARSEEIYRAMLRDLVQEPRSPAPTWLGRVAAALTPIERAAVASGTGPAWLEAVIALRIELRRSRLDIDEHSDDERQLDRVVQLCCAMATECEGCSAEVAVQVTRIRADLLREVFGAPGKYRAGIPAERVAPAVDRGAKSEGVGGFAP